MMYMLQIQEQHVVKAIKGGIYAIFFLPLAVVPLFLFPFTTTRAFLFQIIVEVIFALWAVLAFKNPAYRPARSPVFFALCGYFTALMLSTIFGLDLYRSFFGNLERMWGFFQLSHFFLFFVVLIGMFRTKEEWTRVLNAALVAGFLVAASGVTQYLYDLFSSGAASRVSGLIGNPAFLAGYLFFILAFFLLFYSDTGKKWYLAGAVPSLFVILATGTRGAAAALGAVAVAVSLLSLILIKKWQVRSGAVLFLLLFCLSVGWFFASGALFEKPEKVSESDFYSKEYIGKDAGTEKSDLFTRLARFSIYDPTAMTRLATWKTTLGAVRDYPLFGAGPENYILAFNKYFNPEFYTAERHEIWFDRAHNAYIDTLVMYGWVGFLAYLSVFGAAAWTVWSLFRKNELSITGFLVWVGLGTAYLAQNFFLFDTFAVFLMFMVALAYLHQIQGQPLDTSKGCPWMAGTVPVSLVCVALAISFGTVYLFTFRPALAAFYLSRAQSGEYDQAGAMKLYQKAIGLGTFASNEARSHMALGAAQEAQQYREKEVLPEDVAGRLSVALEALKTNIEHSHEQQLIYRLQFSDVYNLRLSRTGEVSSETEDIVRKSIEISPGRMEFEFALAQTEFLKNNFEEAVRILQEASQKNPDHQEPYWKIAQIYNYAGETDKAIPFLEKALWLGRNASVPGELLWAEKYYVEHEDLVKLIHIDTRILALIDTKSDEAFRIHQNLAKAYALLGLKEKAVFHARKMGEIAPSQLPAIEEFIRSL